MKSKRINYRRHLTPLSLVGDLDAHEFMPASNAAQIMGWMSMNENSTIQALEMATTKKKFPVASYIFFNCFFQIK